MSQGNAPVNVFHGPPTPGDTREWAVKVRVKTREMTKIDSFCATGEGEGVNVRWLLLQGKHRKITTYLIMPLCGGMW